MKFFVLPLLLIAAPALAQHAEHQAAPAAPTAQSTQPEHASEADTAAVLATIDAMFAAMTAKDAATFLFHTLPEGNATAAYTTDAGERRVVTRDWASFAAGLPAMSGTPVERNIGPHVHIDGDIAMVWTEYVMTLDGEFSHCGTNHFDLVRKDGAWKVLNVTWTMRKTGCPAE